MIITELPKSKHKKFLIAAYAVALSGPGCGGSVGFRHGAVIVRKGRIIAARYNCRKTHPKLYPRYAFPFLHAESYSIVSLGMDNCAYTTMYVVRVTRDGHLALSKPCLECQGLIHEAKLKDVYYSIDDGFRRL